MATRDRREYGAGSVHQAHTKDCPRERACGCKWRGTIEAGWTDTGRRRRITVTAKTKAEAQRKVRNRLAEIERAGRKTSSAAQQRKTVKSWIDEWNAIRVKEVRPKTYTSDESATRRWVVPAIGARRLADLTAADWRKVERRIRDAGVGAATVTRTRTVFVKLLRDAAADGYPVPPLMFELGREQRKRDQKRATGKRTSVPIPDALALIGQAGQLPHGSRYLFGFLYGIRQGETLGLTWDAIDFERGLINIEWQLQALPYNVRFDRSSGFRVPDDYEARQLTGRFHLVRPKTASGERVVPLLDMLRTALETWREIQPPNPHGLVWARADGWPIDKSDDADEWKALQDRAGIRHPSGRHYVGHEMRNTTATMLRALDIPQWIIVAILGHASILSSQTYMDDAKVEELAVALREVEAALGRGTRPAIRS